MEPSQTLPAPANGFSELAGWGANTRALCDVREPDSPADIGRFIEPNGTIARGLGRSYGDAAINAQGRVLGMHRCDRYLAFDEATASLTCEGGVSLEQIIADFAPRGLFPMITPGTKYVTVAGCIANDVHGKAHHAQGSFSTCVVSMQILLPDGSIVTASREQHPELFWGTFGGMGLLGIILSATIILRRIETTYFRQKAIVVRDLESMLAALDEYDQQFPYSVAYVDPVAKGAQLGRGILTVGDHAALQELPPKLAREPLFVSKGPKLVVPFELPEFTLNPLSIRALNIVLKTMQSHARPFGHYEKFFYPLDMLRHWNRGYGRRGFTQYQFVIPFDDGLNRLREILTTIVSSGQLPFLNVLKRLGKESEGLLSFPKEGYTFAIDFPIRAGTIELVHRLDRMVLEAGGRIYLGKDSYVEPDIFRAMYPRLDEFLALKAKIDPNGIFTSNLARRVGLVT